MQKVTVNLKNCYGIGEVSCAFDFNRAPVHAVYAPNGFMKTSFARTLSDLSRNEDSRDQMFPTRVSVREVTDESGASLSAEHVLVVPPYEESYQPKNVSTLLVEASLKAEYEAAVAAVEQRKGALLGALKARSGLTGRTVTPESELCTTLGVPSLLDDVDALVALAASADAGLASVEYSVLFSEKALQFLSSKDAMAQIANYVQHFDDLVSKSPILTTQFNHTQAGTLHKTLQDSRFFDAQHWLMLNNGNGDQPLEIRDATALRDRVDEEMSRVLADAKLRKSFEAFDKKISANVELRSLREYLHANQAILPLLADPVNLRRHVWGAYLASEKPLLDELHQQYSDSRSVIEKVISQAKAQATEWSEVVSTFNERFSVPFELRVENQADVILKDDAPRVAFVFRDDGDTKEVGTSKELLQALSQGERRALYLLNVIFELRARLKAGTPVLVVVDDIADSFDYRNKYAIIEYLQDVSRSGLFRLIILTHNFDFHRSVAGRLGIPRDNRRLAVRSGRTVSLVPEKYQKNPLTHWQSDSSNPAKFLASIPFVRNLAEYCGRQDVFDALTEVLHLKAGTLTMTLADLDTQYQKVIHNYSPPGVPCRTTLVADLLRGTAASIASATAEHVELEEKLVLSMAIRLIAEQHMIDALADPTFVGSITKDQTQRLLQEYRSRFPGNRDQLCVLGQVQLMTPENIHLNSFMFEPILDLGIVHLRQLHADVAAL
jgi:hypothetical protein